MFIKKILAAKILIFMAVKVYEVIVIVVIISNRTAAEF